MRRATHRGERIEESLENASLAQPVKALPHAVPMTKTFRQGPPPNILDREEMKGLEKPSVIFGFPSPPRKAGAKHRKRMRPIVLIHPCRHIARPPIRSETYESCPSQSRNPKKIRNRKFVHTA
jgi:hypothetical protein